MDGVSGAKRVQMSEEVCDGLKRADRGCPFGVQAGHVTEFMFSSCHQCGITKMSASGGQREKCAF